MLLTLLDVVAGHLRWLLTLSRVIVWTCRSGQARIAIPSTPLQNLQGE